MCEMMMSTMDDCRGAREQPLLEFEIEGWGVYVCERESECAAEEDSRTVLMIDRGLEASFCHWHPSKSDALIAWKSLLSIIVKCSACEQPGRVRERACERVGGSKGNRNHRRKRWY